MEAAGSFETLITFFQITQHCISEKCDFPTARLYPNLFSQPLSYCTNLEFHLSSFQSVLEALSPAVKQPLRTNYTDKSDCHLSAKLAPTFQD
jgi:hypothetical protein